MAIILSQSNVNVVEMLATRIEVQWDFRNNTGPALFYFERVDWDGKAYINERSYHSTVRAEIEDMIQGTYTIQDPTTGEDIEEPAWKLMALIKAATDRAWDWANNPREVPEEGDTPEPVDPPTEEPVNPPVEAPDFTDPVTPPQEEPEEGEE